MSVPEGVVVYCASSSDIDPKYIEAARQTGALIARAGLTLVSGGGRAGLMAAAIDGALAAGGRTVGVLPRFMFERSWQHPGLTECRVTSGMHSRKEMMASMSRAAIALPGGIGTLDELCEIMTWRQLGLFKGPVVIVNLDGFFDPLLEMFTRMRDLGFMRGGIIPAAVVATPGEAIELIARPK